jgi:ABC-2 type transport system permease protein
VNLASEGFPPSPVVTPGGEPFVRYGLWHYVWKLLRLRVLLTLSGFRQAKLVRKIIIVIAALAFLAFAVLVFMASWWLLGLLHSPYLTQALAQQNLGSLTGFLESVPALVLAGAFMGILLTSFGVLLQALYLAGDMDFLLSTPVPIRAVFITKMLQAILPNFGLIALFGLPVLLGLGASSGYNVLYYPLVVIVLASLALAAAGLSSLLVMGVVRIFPARRVAEVLGFFGALISIICSQSGNLISSTDFANKQFASQGVPLTWITRFNTPWSPLVWPGRALVDLGEGRWLTGIGFLALTLGLAGLAFAISLTTAERLYYTGWASIQISIRKKAPPRALPHAQGGRSRPVALVERLIPSAVRAIVVKDFIVLRRDLRNMSQVVTPIIFGIIYAISLMHTGGEPPPGQGEAPGWLMQILRSLMVYGNVGISLFVGWSLLSRLALMGFSQEGKNYWLLKSAPVRAGELLAAKFLVAYLPSLALGWIFMVIISLMQRSTLAVLVFGLGVVALSIAGTAGINLAFGVAGTNLNWEDPRRMNAGWWGCLSMPMSFAFLAFSLGFFFAPPVILTGLGLPEALGQVIGLGLGGVVCLACAMFIPRLAVDRVARIGEA